MSEADAKQQTQNQYIALSLVLIGLISTFIGCFFHFSEMTTAAVGVIGLGGGMLTGQHMGGNSLHAGGGIAVNEANPS